MTLSELKIPIAGGIGVLTTAIALAWGVFVWADDLKDQQAVTQTQLDQLVVIISQKTVNDEEKFDVQAEDIERVERAFELLKRELEIRREIEERGEDETQ